MWDLTKVYEELDKEMESMELKCTKCGCDLEKDYTIDVVNEGSYIECHEKGHCPECYTEYQWTEYFEFDRIDGFKEI